MVAALLLAILLPQKPHHYVTDRAGVIRNPALLDKKLANFERLTSDQILVYVDQHLPPDTTIEEMGSEAIRQWGVGQKGKDNGVILFVFVADRKMRVEVGYGLEPTLTDAKAKQITSEVIKPKFFTNDYDGGINDGVEAILATVRGAPFKSNIPEHHLPLWLCPTGLFLLIAYVAYVTFAAIRARVLKRRSWGGVEAFQWYYGSGGGGGDGSSGSSSDGGSFEGGGGSGGGGGASDSW